MLRRVSFCVLLVATLLAINGLAARGATVDDGDHHMEEGEHEEETVNSVSCTAYNGTEHSSSVGLACVVRRYSNGLVRCAGLVPCAGFSAVCIVYIPKFGVAMADTRCQNFA